jgi:hypothetical protein
MENQSLPKCDENLGEIICPECKGTGSISAGVYIAKTCSKCQGNGKLDWCQQAVGVAPKPYFHFDTSGVSTFNMMNGTYADTTAVVNSKIHSQMNVPSEMLIESTPTGKSNWFRDMYMNILDKAVEKLAFNIDREILRSFEDALEHNEKETCKGRYANDHRVFSELMFFPSVKSEVKNKKD